MAKRKPTSDTLRVGARVVISAGPNPWREGASLLVVKRDCNFKREWVRNTYHDTWGYFVVAEGDPPGAGCWIPAKNLRALSPLEELGAQAVL